MDCKNKILNSPYFLVAIVIIIISLILTLYWAFTRKPFLDDKNKGLDDLKSISCDISKINSTLTSCIDNQSINADITSNTLEETIPELEKLKSTLSEIQVSTENVELKESLSTSLDYNLNIYNIILNILESPKSSEIINLFSKLQIENEHFFNSLHNFNDKPVDYTLSSDTKVFINNSIGYIKNLVKINRDLSLTRANIKDYIASVYPLYSSLNDIGLDLFTPLKDVGTNIDGLNRIDNNIYKKQLSLSAIKNKLIEISVPNNCMDNYTLFNESIDSCEKYLSALSSDVKNTINTGSESNYDEAETNYHVFKDSLDKFYTNYNNLK